MDNFFGFKVVGWMAFTAQPAMKRGLLDVVCFGGMKGVMMSGTPSSSPMVMNGFDEANPHTLADTVPISGILIFSSASPKSSLCNFGAPLASLSAVSFCDMNSKPGEVLLSGIY